MKVTKQGVSYFKTYQLNLLIESEDEHIFLRALMNNREALVKLVNEQSNYKLDKPFDNVPNNLDSEIFFALGDD